MVSAFSSKTGFCNRCNNQVSNSTAETNSSWPSSTPMLKKTSANGIACCGRPTSAKAPAKPKPCNKPKMKAISQGHLAAAPGCPFFPCTISTAKNKMLSAITASTGCCGTWMNPSVAHASVMLCAMVHVSNRARNKKKPAWWDGWKNYRWSY